MASTGYPTNDNFTERHCSLFWKSKDLKDKKGYGPIHSDGCCCPGGVEGEEPEHHWGKHMGTPENPPFFKNCLAHLGGPRLQICSGQLRVEGAEKSGEHVKATDKQKRWL